MNPVAGLEQVKIKNISTDWGVWWFGTNNN
ncbi:MAG: hypothetical protein K0Q87_64 [Neobacillus sp.]|nr:hypothetical protein [Neobacillus sp.]